MRVPGAKSWEGLPATVTRPGFLGCRSCRWLPRRATSVQPSSFNIRRTARTFIHPAWHSDDCRNYSQISAIRSNRDTLLFCRNLGSTPDARSAPYGHDVPPLASICRLSNFTSSELPIPPSGVARRIWKLGEIYALMSSVYDWKLLSLPTGGLPN